LKAAVDDHRSVDLGDRDHQHAREAKCALLEFDHEVVNVEPELLARLVMLSVEWHCMTMWKMPSMFQGPQGLSLIRQPQEIPGIN
jgi:hypothetical protein